MMNKVLNIIIGIILIVIGFFAFFSPFITIISLQWIATIGFLVFGVYQILFFIFVKPRSGWQLANGIINVILGILLLTSGIQMRIDTFSIILAILLLFAGIEGLSTASILRSAGGTGTGWITFSSIVAILGFVFMMFAPVLFSAITIGYLFSIYLIVGGIVLIAHGVSKKSGKKKQEEEEETQEESPENS